MSRSDSKKLDWMQHLVTLGAVCIGGLLTYFTQDAGFRQGIRKDFLISLAKEGPNLISEMDSCVNAVYESSFEPLRGEVASGLNLLGVKVDDCVVVFDRSSLNFSIYINDGVSDEIRKIGSRIRSLQRKTIQAQELQNRDVDKDNVLLSLPEDAVDLSRTWSAKKEELLSRIYTYASEQSKMFN
ncbi:MAG: hypothetical protein NDI61_10515 [Bdellovibrionaceae bacterium]|nr:hypothetical protein [Pseudobdellovibrionaceae bacterium]